LNRTARITVLSFSGSRPVKELKFRFYALKYIGFKSWREKEAPQKNSNFIFFILGIHNLVVAFATDVILIGMYAKINFGAAWL